MRSGFVAGDAAIIKKFLLYRTYQGCAMSPPMQAASIAAWKRRSPRRGKPRASTARNSTPRSPILRDVTEVGMPDAAFYLWMRTPIPTTRIHARAARATQCVRAARQLSRARSARREPRHQARAHRAGRSTAECTEAAQRIARILSKRVSNHMTMTNCKPSSNRRGNSAPTSSRHRATPKSAKRSRK